MVPPSGMLDSAISPSLSTKLVGYSPKYENYVSYANLIETRRFPAFQNPSAGSPIPGGHVSQLIESRPVAPSSGRRRNYVLRSWPLNV